MASYSEKPVVGYFVGVKKISKENKLIKITTAIVYGFPNSFIGWEENCKKKPTVGADNRKSNSNKPAQAEKEDNFFIHLEFDKDTVLDEIVKVVPQLEMVMNSISEDESQDTFVEDSLLHNEPASEPVLEPFLHNANNELPQVDSQNVIVQRRDEVSNPNDIFYLRIVGKLWGDDEPDEELEEDGCFTEVLSKSKKKKLKKKCKNEKVEGFPSPKLSPSLPAAILKEWREFHVAILKESSLF
ncbi:unnamed protein product [Lupinus luteus]|uniref:Uncharacterized protein n=1 Tax=Lupinus luteus TaxID=3873 RepID=A0AAV1WU97_LUPLU